MKKAVWLASVLGLAVAAWATTGDVSVGDMGNYASQQDGEGDSVVRRGRGSSGGSSGSYGRGGRRNRSRGSSGGSWGSHG